MKAYLVTTGTLFGLMALLHICRVIAEWPRAFNDHWFALEMALTIILPGLLASWAFGLLRRPVRNRSEAMPPSRTER